MHHHPEFLGATTHAAPTFGFPCRNTGTRGRLYRRSGGDCPSDPRHATGRGCVGVPHWTGASGLDVVGSELGRDVWGGPMLAVHGCTAWFGALLTGTSHSSTPSWWRDSTKTPGKSHLTRSSSRHRLAAGRHTLAQQCRSYTHAARGERAPDLASRPPLCHSHCAN